MIAGEPGADVALTSWRSLLADRDDATSARSLALTMRAGASWRLEGGDASLSVDDLEELATSVLAVRAVEV